MSAPRQRARRIGHPSLDWQGERIAVTYEADWLEMGLSAHLTVQAEREGPGVLPITATGYHAQLAGRVNTVPSTNVSGFGS